MLLVFLTTMLLSLPAAVLLKRGVQGALGATLLVFLGHND
jgi:hypothetical protein